MPALFFFFFFFSIFLEFGKFILILKRVIFVAEKLQENLLCPAARDAPCIAEAAV